MPEIKNGTKGACPKVSQKRPQVSPARQKAAEKGTKMKIYIAAPLFNEGERAFNERIDAIIRECGHETFLPQREGGCVADLPDEIEGMPKRKYLFQLDCKHMDWCDAILILLDGRVPDEGACFELGYCYAKGKR